MQRRRRRRRLRPARPVPVHRPGAPARSGRTTNNTNSTPNLADQGHYGDAFYPEHRASSFYSNPAVTANGRATQLAIGTTRVWYSSGLGPRSHRKCSGLVPAVGHAALAGSDPRKGTRRHDNRRHPARTAAAGTDRHQGHGVRVLRWGDADRLYVVMPGAIYRLDRGDEASGSGTGIDKRPTLPVRARPPAGRAAARTCRRRLANDLAVHDVTAGPHGSFYVATSHPVEPVWWFDGKGRFHPCGLGADGDDGAGLRSAGRPRRPVHCVCRDGARGFPGELSFAGESTLWLTWHEMNNGLPEAAASRTSPSPRGRTRAGSSSCGPACSRGACGSSTCRRSARPNSPSCASPPVRHPTVLPPPDARSAPTRTTGTGTGRWTPRRYPTATPACRPAARRRTRTARPRRLPVARESRHPGPAGTGGEAAARSGQHRHRAVPVEGRQPGERLPTERFLFWAVQTALHALDPRIVPDGFWRLDFFRLLKAIRADRAASGRRDCGRGAVDQPGCPGRVLGRPVGAGWAHRGGPDRAGYRDEDPADRRGDRVGRQRGCPAPDPHSGCVCVPAGSRSRRPGARSRRCLELFGRCPSRRWTGCRSRRRR